MSTISYCNEITKEIVLVTLVWCSFLETLETSFSTRRCMLSLQETEENGLNLTFSVLRDSTRSVNFLGFYLNTRVFS